MSTPMQAGTVTIDAPWGGWDAFNSLDNMPPENAILLDNLIPGSGTVDTRLGSIEYADLGTGYPVETVADYSPKDGTETTLLAASAGGMWSLKDNNMPVGTIPGGRSLEQTEIAAPGSFTHNRWQSANFTRLDEQSILIMCNGADPVQIYDGATLTPAVFNDSDGNPLSPVFVGVLIFKGRAYYWEENDNSFWYCQPGSFQGEIQKFEMGSFVVEGGFLSFLTSWTQQDSGDGKDDFFVAAFGSGEILIYQGDDPETVGYWDMVGRYIMAEPLSIRGHARFGSDTIIMTKDGYVALSSIVQQGRTSDVAQFSRIIHGAVTRQTKLRAGLFGWQATLFQKQGLFIFNVPYSKDTFVQHVMNTVTQRWCRFRGLDVTCMVAHNNRLFGGTRDGRVLALLEGTSDEGRPIQFAALPAYNYLGDSGRQKHLTAIQPLTTSTQPKYINVVGYADYDVPTVVPVEAPPELTAATWSINPATPPTAVGSFWDEAFWANQDVPTTTKGWQNISAYGFAVSYLLRMAKVNETVSWRACTIRYHIAGAQ